MTDKKHSPYPLNKNDSNTLKENANIEATKPDTAAFVPAYKSGEESTLNYAFPTWKAHTEAFDSIFHQYEDIWRSLANK